MEKSCSQKIFVTFLMQNTKINRQNQQWDR